MALLHIDHTTEESFERQPYRLVPCGSDTWRRLHYLISSLEERRCVMVVELLLFVSIFPFVPIPYWPNILCDHYFSCMFFFTTRAVREYPLSCPFVAVMFLSLCIGKKIQRTISTDSFIPFVGQLKNMLHSSPYYYSKCSLEYLLIVKICLKVTLAKQISKMCIWYRRAGR